MLLIKNALKPFAKSVLISLWLTAAASTTQKKISGSSITIYADNPKWINYWYHENSQIVSNCQIEKSVLFFFLS